MKRDGRPERRRLPACILPDGSVVDITWQDGVIESLVAAPGRGSTVVLPRLVEAHVHLDKTFFGGDLPAHRRAASLAERIEHEAELLADARTEPVASRAARLLDALVANGAGAVRSHVDVSGRLGLSRVEPLLELARRSPVPLQLCAFPQEGVGRRPGTARMLASALDAGCEVVGGLDPAELDADRDGQLELVVGLAAARGLRVDLHLHERAAVGAATILAYCRHVSSAALHGRAALSHGFALADLWRSGGSDALRPVAEAMRESGVSLVTSLPGEGLCPPIGALVDSGVEVVVASDNIGDAWSPFGRADPLERAATAAQLEGWRTDSELLEAVALVSTAASRLLGLPACGLSPGSPADLTLVEARSLREAVAAQPPRRAVLVGGEIVSGGDLLWPAWSPA